MSNLADQLEQMRARTDATPSSQQSVDRLTEQLEQMRIRMNEVAKREGSLAAELNLAIRRMDDQLLHEVRAMAAEHEARRANILNELQAFAAQLDGLPDRHRQRPSLGGGTRGLLSNSPPSAPRLSVQADDRQRTIQDALTRLNQQSPPH
jgi:chromosome segregation ATPase